MKEKDQIAIMSILIALVALIILLISISYTIMNAPAKDASIETVINPLTSTQSTDNFNVIKIKTSSDDEEEDNGDAPQISGLPDITLNFSQVFTLDLDSYASDTEDSDSDLTFTAIYTPTTIPAPITISINSLTHVLTITEVNGVWTGIQAVTIRVTDTDSNTDTDYFIVNITNDTGTSPSGPGVPVVSNIPDIAFGEDGTDNTIDLDNYVTDSDHAVDQLTWAYSGNTNINVIIDGLTHVVTFTAAPNWFGDEWITFTTTDPLGNFDEDTILVTVTPVDDPTIWLPLSDQTINEDSASGTIIYANILGQVSDVDSTTVINVISTHTHFTVSMSGNNLVISNLEANWDGSEVVVLESNGITATFTLTINKLLDDLVTVCVGNECFPEWD